MNLTIVELTQRDAELFREFREHYRILELVIGSEIIGLKNGKAILSFNSDGDLANIKIEKVVYKR